MNNDRFAALEAQPLSCVIAQIRIDFPTPESSVSMEPVGSIRIEFHSTIGTEGAFVAIPTDRLASMFSSVYGISDAVYRHQLTAKSRYHEEIRNGAAERARRQKMLEAALTLDPDADPIALPDPNQLPPPSPDRLRLGFVLDIGSASTFGWTFRAEEGVGFNVLADGIISGDDARTLLALISNYVGIGVMDRFLLAERRASELLRYWALNA